MAGQEIPDDTAPKPDSVNNADDLTSAAQAQAGGVSLDAHDAAKAAQTVAGAAREFWTEFEQAAKSDPQGKLSLRQHEAQFEEDMHLVMSGKKPKHITPFPMAGAIGGDEAAFGWLLKKLGVPLEKAAARLAGLSPAEKEVLGLRKPFFEGGPQRTLEQTGKLLDPPAGASKVWQVEQSALKKLLTADPLEGLSVRSRNILRKLETDLGIELDTPEKVSKFGLAEIRRVKGVGKVIENEIKTWLNERGYHDVWEDLSPHARKVLQGIEANHGIELNTPEKVAALPHEQIEGAAGAGEVTANEIQTWLKGLNLLKQDWQQTPALWENLSASAKSALSKLQAKEDTPLDTLDKITDLSEETVRRDVPRRIFYELKGWLAHEYGLSFKK